MDVQSHNTRERVFSILNNNDCESFVHRTKQSSATPSPIRLPSISSLTSSLNLSPRLERPSLARLPQFGRNSSISSVGSPPLLRYDSSSSTKSNSSMEGTPSPITPSLAYNLNYNDAALMPYDAMLRQDSTLNYLPSPTGITPFVEQSLVMGPMPGQEAIHPKSHPQLMPAAYPQMPMPNEMVQMPTPALSTDLSVSSNASTNQVAPAHTPATSNGTAPQPKKNKYPCPYAQSHNCSATFTTSGHAARHGKKHTGEKGVHCPVCDKAFTRKDNMKQHERTHKNRGPNMTEKKSKAQATREADQAKEIAEQEQTEIPIPQPQIMPTPAQFRKSSSGLSDGTLPGNLAVTPVDISPSFFADPNPQIVHPDDVTLLDPTGASLYPPLVDEALLMSGSMPTNDKLDILPQVQPPTLVRGFSDLDTLAQAASESQFDPYFAPQQF